MPPEGYEPLLSSTASALGKWLDQQPEEGVALKNELIAIYKDRVKVGVVTREWVLSTRGCGLYHDIQTCVGLQVSN